MNLFRLLDLFLAGGLFCGGALLLALIFAFVYAAVRERQSRGRLILCLLLVTVALSACGTLRLEVVAPTVEPSATPGLSTATRERVTATRQPAGADSSRASATRRNPSATPTAAGPTFSDVFFCLEPCAEDGSNARTNFPSGIDTIYSYWQYQNVAAGAEYERIWRSRGEEWVTYACSWPGPSQGEEMITLTEPDGLRSGRWELVIRVEGQEVLRKGITLTGDHDYWYPAGHFDSCYGKLSLAPTPSPTPTSTPPPPRPTRPPAPTATPTSTATSTATPFPLAIDRFAVSAVEPLAQGKRVSFAWEATAREALIRAQTKAGLNPTWTVPVSGTLTVDVVESDYRDPRFVLEVSDGDPLAPAVITRTVQLEWPCQHPYFFTPSPDLCASGPAVETQAAYQPFEHGHMVWRANDNDIFVFYEDGTWQRFDNLWQQESAQDEAEEPPDGLYQPVRGFGLIWEGQEGVRERLGWGTAPEGARTVTYQAQIPLSQRRLLTYWQVSGEGLLLLASHGTLAGDWEPVAGRGPAEGGLTPR